MTSTRLTFELPPSLEATVPPEARGLARDAVRLLVAHRESGELVHTTFRHLPQFLDAGDLVVVNTSATIPAAIDARGTDGSDAVIHLSTCLTEGLWVVEPRRREGQGSARWSDGTVPRRFELGRRASVELMEPFLESNRLWVARLSLPTATLAWLAVHGRPIRYSYVEQAWPLSSYQNVYATEPGSAEMPSAGRPLSMRVITELVAKGVSVAPIVLHTGVASLEADEHPYPERVRVPPSTAAHINETHRAGGRVIAVGTTVVRAVETAAGHDGIVAPVDDWTDLIVTPERGVRAIDGIVTGWHEPAASHLDLLEAIARPDLLQRSYEASLAAGYLWHEFGDSHLVIP
ncbi:MAG TPA: S-adenosylmethionine:tRNA ribosyltransferase-isomerase [Acidimicrobiales bacterium]